MLDAPLISYEKSILYTQKQKSLDRDEKIKLQKYFMCHKLGLDVLTLDIIKKFYNKFYLIDNLIYLIDIKNYKLTNDATNIMNFNKTKIIKELIIDIGYNNIFNSKYITNDELLTNFKMIFNNSELYSNQKAAKLNYNIPYFKFDSSISSKQILGHINTVLRDYSVKISKYQQTIKNIKHNFYQLEIINDVDEMIKSKIDNHDYNLIDSNNIFKCDKNNLEKLIIKYEKNKILKLYEE